MDGHKNINRGLILKLRENRGKQSDPVFAQNPERRCGWPDEQEMLTLMLLIQG